MNKDIKNIYKAFLISHRIYTDSRKVDGAGIFFALKGSNYNGNKYVDKALSAGASIAIVDDFKFAKRNDCILVDDVLTALQRLAAWHRQQFSIPILAITGTNGKTTTKELTSNILSCQFNTLSTIGNKNNHIGVPLTLLRIDKSHEIAVIEMGANQPNDIELLCKLAQPTHGLITNIGKAHLEGFLTEENIFKTKKELYDFIISTDGIFYLNDDENFSSKLEIRDKVITYGKNEDCRFQISTALDGHFVSGSYIKNDKVIRFDTRVFGAYNSANIKSAIAIALHFKVDDRCILSGLENFKSDNNRSQLIRRGSSHIILDAYNANPVSMNEAIDSFVTVNATIKILILGDMLELGDFADQEHNLVIEKILTHNWYDLILIGEIFSKNNKAYKAFDSIYDAKDYLSKINTTNSWILIKGSRAKKLEVALDYLNFDTSN